MLYILAPLFTALLIVSLMCWRKASLVLGFLFLVLGITLAFCKEHFADRHDYYVETYNTLYAERLQNNTSYGHMNLPSILAQQQIEQFGEKVDLPFQSSASSNPFDIPAFHEDLQQYKKRAITYGRLEDIAEWSWISVLLGGLLVGLYFVRSRRTDTL
ncbi:MAG: hypothetical protein IKA50_05510 [Clostridia bacterium]|nr:hypothetical protein [Clostridia bacterium]